MAESRYRELRIRVPVELHHRLKVAAAVEHRSLNSLVRHLLADRLPTTVRFDGRDGK